MYTPLYHSLLSLAPTTPGAQKVLFLYMSYHRRESDDITPADALGASVPTDSQQRFHCLEHPSYTALPKLPSTVLSIFLPGSVETLHMKLQLSVQVLPLSALVSHLLEHHLHKAECTDCFADTAITTTIWSTVRAQAFVE